MDLLTLGRQSGEYSPPALCFALTAINSAISLGTEEVQGLGLEGRGFVFWVMEGGNVLLQCTSLIS